MFNIIETTNIPYRRPVIATVESFADAKAKVAAMGVAFMEDDADNAGCADAFLSDGRLMAIEPVGFSL